MSQARKTWTTNFENAIMSARGRKLPVRCGVAWHVGRCVIHLDAEKGRASALLVHALSEPHEGDGGRGGAAPESIDFKFALGKDEPFVAATIVLRWVKSREGDRVGL